MCTCSHETHVKCLWLKAAAESQLKYLLYGWTLWLHCHNHVYTATVVLDFSVGMRGACPREMVTYTCTVNQGFVLEWVVLDWIIEPFVSIADPIRFVLDSTPVGRSVDCNGVTPPQCSNITFVATFTITTNRMWSCG